MGLTAPAANAALIARLQSIIDAGPPEAVAQEAADFMVASVLRAYADPDGPARWIDENTEPEQRRLDAPFCYATASST